MDGLCRTSLKNLAQLFLREPFMGHVNRCAPRARDEFLEGSMKIAIFGLGYVGMTAAACLTREGHQVVGIDTSEEKVATVNSGRSPITEPGLDELIAAAVRDGLLLAASDAAPHLDTCAMAIVCVGTPSAPDGSHNMGYIAEVSRQIASLTSRSRKEPLTVVYRSTVRPGTLEELVMPIFEQVLDEAIGNIELAYNPEFLRESVAIKDYFNPPKIVIGTRDGKPCKNLEIVNANLQAPVFYTKYREAEITKFVDNTFHAVKVAFANEIGRVCTQLGIDAQKVHEIFVSDTKLNISTYYLRPGGAFGGSCLPKDVRALQYISSDTGAHTHLIDSLLRSNEAHKNFLVDLCAKGIPAGAKVLMIGLAFKANSDDLRESPNIDLARKLLNAGYSLSIFDPHVEPARLLGQNLGYAYLNLPALRKLLISEQEMESTEYDLVIDTRGWAKQYQVKSGRTVDINALK
jgi:GDP-mannose 6-dehydrogenase